MVKRSLSLLFIVLALSSLLVACGDAVIPTYANATATTLPDSFKQVTDAFGSGFSNPQVSVYKTSDSPDTVRTTLDNSFKSNGWTAASNADNSKLASYGQGAFAAGYGNGDTGAIVVGLPGSDVTRAVGFTDVQDGQTVFMIISGKAKS